MSVCEPVYVGGVVSCDKALGVPKSGLQHVLHFCLLERMRFQQSVTDGICHITVALGKGLG